MSILNRELRDHVIQDFSACLRRPLFSAMALFMACSLSACGGGGSGPEGLAGSSKLSLSGFAVGRGVITDSGINIVSPLTIATLLDDETSLARPEGIEPIGVGIDTTQLISFRVDHRFEPPIIPRNGVLALKFTAHVDPASVIADTFDDEGLLLREGSLSVRDLNGLNIPVSLFVREESVLINPLVDESIGWPPSPVVFDGDGTPYLEPNGFLRITFPSEVEKRLRSTRGFSLSPSDEELGEQEHPLSFNPGNDFTDFIEIGGFFPNSEHFHGFLPDRTPPRIRRTHRVDGVLDTSQGDAANPFSLTLSLASFESRTWNGIGEWRNGVLVLRPGEADEESLLIESNSRTQLRLAQPMTRLLENGETYEIRREELFEPSLLDPIEPERFDLHNPQNDKNKELRSFLEAFEIDENGNPFGDSLSVMDPLPSRSMIRLTFTEPMSEISVNPYESFRVMGPSIAGIEWTHRRALTSLDQRQTRLSIRPVLQDPQTGQLQVLGWSSETLSQRLELVTAPTVEFLEGRYRPDQVLEAVNQGFRALTDISGQPLAFPESLYDLENSHVAFTADFNVDGDPSLPKEENVVQTFRGLPLVEINPKTGEPAVLYRDSDLFWGPNVVNYNLEIAGFLSSKPPRRYQRVFDDENPTPDRPMTAWPFGVSVPIGGYLSRQNLYSALYGVKFQHIYRNSEASPFPGIDGLPLELWRVSWSPIGGSVSEPPDVFEDISIRVAHSTRSPTGAHKSGIGVPFTEASYIARSCTVAWADGPNFVGEQTEVISRGRAYSISRDSLFTPATSSRAYISWPVFERVFDYDNTRSINIEYRVSPQQLPISYANGFTFSILQLGWPRPYIRAWSIGQASNMLDPYNESDRRNICATGPAVGQNTIFGDNSIYYGAFDFTQTRSLLDSPWLGGYQGEGSIAWQEPVIEPPIPEQPENVQIVFKYRGSDNSDGSLPSDWVFDIQELNEYRFVQFRVEVIGDFASTLVPTFDHIVIPYHVF